MKEIYRYLLNQNNYLGLFFAICAIFYIMTYITVGSLVPSSIPVHHDDYSNYARILVVSDLSLIRPLSTFIIQVLSNINPELLIYGVRFLTVSYLFLIFYMLTEVFEIKLNFMLQLLISILIFSTPISVEYSRYTGMITHLISGNLAILSILFINKGIKLSKLYFVIIGSFTMFLSVISKEDFILFYLLIIFYFFIINFKNRLLNRNIILFIILGIILLFSVIIFSKIASSSSFLGTVNLASTYYLDVKPTSIIETIIKYLSGANHPSLLFHGQFVIIIFVFALFVNLFYAGKNNINDLFAILLAITIILPYSVLPNHINAYYELLWIPFIYIGFITSLNRLLKDVSVNKYLYSIIFLLSILIFIGILIVDYNPRKSIANWYENVALSNSKTINVLLDNKELINKEKQICILGADSFSPWFMHNGNYLSNVLGIYSTWYVIPITNEIRQGFILSEQMNNQIKIVEFCPIDIHKIDLRDKL